MVTLGADSIPGVTEQIRIACASGQSTKWVEARTLLDKHGIAAGTGQLLVFTEFADTARWPAGVFDAAATRRDARGHRRATP